MSKEQAEKLIQELYNFSQNNKVHYKSKTEKLVMLETVRDVCEIIKRSIVNLK